jgi:hypothetical protein
MSETNATYRIFQVVSYSDPGQQPLKVLIDKHIVCATPEEAEATIIGKFERGDFTYLPIIKL